MKEKVLEILEQSDRALSIEELDQILGNTTVSDSQQLIGALNELCRDYIVYHSNKDKYMLIEKSHLVKGVLR